MGKNSNEKPHHPTAGKAPKPMLYSITMRPATPAPLDAPGTDAAAASKVAASDANPPGVRW